MPLAALPRPARKRQTGILEMPAFPGRNMMTAVEFTAIPLSEREQRRQLRRAIFASTVGTIIEAYDFLLYVQVAPLVFAKLFFPGSNPLTGTLQAFGIYAVGFVARPWARRSSAISATASGARRP
jgi:hypothetical protein